MPLVPVLVLDQVHVAGKLEADRHVEEPRLHEIQIESGVFDAVDALKPQPLTAAVEPVFGVRNIEVVGGYLGHAEHLVHVGGSRADAQIVTGGLFLDGDAHVLFIRGVGVHAGRFDLGEVSHAHQPLAADLDAVAVHGVPGLDRQLAADHFVAGVGVAGDEHVADMILASLAYLEVHVDRVVLHILGTDRPALHVGVPPGVVEGVHGAAARLLDGARKHLIGTEFDPFQQHRGLEAGVAADRDRADLVRFALAQFEDDVHILRIVGERRERHVLDLEVQIARVVVLVAQPRLIQLQLGAVQQTVVQKIVHEGQIVPVAELVGDAVPQIPLGKPCRAFKFHVIDLEAQVLRHLDGERDLARTVRNLREADVHILVALVVVELAQIVQRLAQFEIVEQRAFCQRQLPREVVGGELRVADQFQRTDPGFQPHLEDDLHLASGQIVHQRLDIGVVAGAVEALDVLVEDLPAVLRPLAQPYVQRELRLGELVRARLLELDLAHFGGTERPGEEQRRQPERQTDFTMTVTHFGPNSSLAGAACMNSIRAG